VCECVVPRNYFHKCIDTHQELHEYVTTHLVSMEVATMDGYRLSYIYPLTRYTQVRSATQKM